MKEFEKISGKNPFKVPENYFEEANRKIISSTVESIHEVRKESIRLKMRPFLFAAASVAGFIIISFSTFRFLTNYRHKTIEVYTESTIEPYLNDLDVTSLEENLKNIEMTNGPSGIKKSDIIDYLMLENIEMDEIFEQL